MKCKYEKVEDEILLRSIWQYREFIYSCVKREFLSKYKGSVLGVVWSVIQPLSLILVYTLIFSNLMKNRLTGMENVPYAYSIYLCSGVLTWGLFVETVTSCTNVFLSNANMMKKVAFPRICLPVNVACSAFVNFVIGFMLFLIFLLLINRFPWTHFPAILIVLLIQTAFSVTLGVGLGVINVFFRDAGQMLNVVLQFWFWLTPVVYPANVLPKDFLIFFNINPLYHIIKSYQTIFLFNEWPDFPGLLFVFVLSLLLGFWALRLYRKHVGEMVDEL